MEAKIKKLTPLGSKLISTFSLNKNKLLIMTKGNRTAIKQELITDDLKSIIKHILRSDFDVEDDVELLEDHEQKLLNELLETCKIDNIFTIRNFHRDTAKNKLITKFNIMKDELLIGNDSPELIEDFKQLIEDLREKKLLTLAEYKKLYKLC